MSTVEISVKLSDGSTYVISTGLEYTLKDIQQMSKDKLDRFSMFIQHNAKNGTDCMIRQIKTGGIPEPFVWLPDYANGDSEFDSFMHHFST